MGKRVPLFNNSVYHPSVDAVAIQTSQNSSPSISKCSICCVFLLPSRREPFMKWFLLGAFFASAILFTVRAQQSTQTQRIPLLENDDVKV
jgi:hypothetical protein